MAAVHGLESTREPEKPVFGEWGLDKPLPPHCANTSLRERGTLEPLPRTANTLEKRVLYVLLVAHPTALNVVELVTRVGAHPGDIEDSLDVLLRQGLVIAGDTAPALVEIGAPKRSYGVSSKHAERIAIELGQQEYVPRSG